MTSSSPYFLSPLVPVCSIAEQHTDLCLLFLCFRAFINPDITDIYLSPSLDAAGSKSREARETIGSTYSYRDYSD